MDAGMEFEVTKAMALLLVPYRVRLLIRQLEWYKSGFHVGWANLTVTRFMIETDVFVR